MAWDRLRGYWNYENTLETRVALYSFRDCDYSQGFWSGSHWYGMLSKHELNFSFTHLVSLQVCVQYKDQSVLEDECLEGRQLGFTGKVSEILIIIFIDWLDSNQQAIHPAQVPTIQSTYVPSSQGMYFCSLHERPELMIDFYSGRNSSCCKDIASTETCSRCWARRCWIGGRNGWCPNAQAGLWFSSWITGSH